MSRTCSLTATALLALVACGGTSHPTPIPPDHARGEPVTTPTNGSFEGRLHAALAAAGDDLIYSPVSISTALAMAREGATRETAAEFDAVLGPQAGADAQALIARLTKPAAPPAYEGAPVAPELAIANRLFADPSAPLLPTFVDVTRTRYLAPIEAVDFRNDFEAGRQRINAWVLEQTRGKIADLLAQGTVDAWTRLVLVNALYLKAQWQTPFAKEATRPAPFAIAGGDTVDAPTMHGQVYGRWGSLGGARMFDLPYASTGDGPQLAMLLVVPNGASLGEVEQAYTDGGLPSLLAALDGGGKAIVSLPTFTLESSAELSEALVDMGMARAFSDDAQFDGISSMPLKLSKVVHKAWAKIDENGTEAAAATAVVMAEITSAGPPPAPPYVFDVDRSFLAFIHDERGQVLFAARVVDPR